jgi:hypothetical protein
VTTRLSPDGMYYWDGANWVTTISPDGRFRWDGAAWIPTGQAYPAGAYQQADRPRRVPTSWTKPLQYSVAGWYAASAVYTLSLPFWMGGQITTVMNQSIQRQQQTQPYATPLPPGFTELMTSFMTGALWISALVGLAFCLLAIVAALNRWTWAFYVVLVLLGFGTLGLLDALYAFAGPSLNAISGFNTPAWSYWVGFLLAIPDTALFIWMIVAMARFGPWAMRKETPAIS